MSKSRYKLKALGFREGYGVFIQALANKLLGSLSSEFKRKSTILDRLYESGVAKVVYSKNKWGINCSIANEFFTVDLRDNSSDFLVFYQVFLRNEYKEFFELINEHDPSAKTLIDLGGNIGLTSLYSKAFLKNPQITIVEPSLENFEALKSNLTANCMDFVALNKGVWSKNTRLAISDKFRDGQAWSLAVFEDKNGSVEAVNLLDLIGDKIVDIVKMDIEGSEFELFKDKSYYDSFLQRIKFIAIEVHGDIGDSQIVSNALLENGFQLFLSGELTIGINMSLIKNNTI